MTILQNKAIGYICQLSDDRLNSAVDFLKFLYEQDYPLDDFDYKLAKDADQNLDNETVTFDAVLREVGLTYEDLSN